jgi:flagellar biosynthesis anti-sigma factor FlgM
MKIDPNAIQPVSPKKTEAVQPVSKNDSVTGPQAVSRSKDRVEVTESARLLAKARVALENTEPADNKRLEMLKQQIHQGTYQVPVDFLSKYLVIRMKG